MFRLDRLRVATIFFIILFLVVIGKLFYIQVIQNEKFRIMAENQQQKTYEIPADRGKIFASGSALVTNEEAYLVYANPQLISDSNETAEKIVPILMEDSRFFSYNQIPQETKDPKTYFISKVGEFLTRTDRQWVAVARKVPAAQVGKLRALNIAGLGFESSPRRFYPEGTLASSIIGFVASDEDGEDKGYNGIEGYYDGDLQGKPGRRMQEESGSREPILIGDQVETPPKNGSDLYLTINRGVQAVLERKIAEGVKRYRAKSGAFVVLESKTGKVLAMGSYPSFDPGNFSPLLTAKEKKSKYQKEFRNLSIATTYEPGSIMKGVTLSAALDSGKVETSWKFIDDGPLRLGSSTITTWDNRHWGKQTLAQLLQKSNNVGAAKLALEIGRETLRSYFLNFGFGSRLGVDLAGEEAGLVKDLKEWRQVDLATAGFGQGVGVTPLQMAAAYGAIANGGILMKPMVVEKIVDQDGREVTLEPTPIHRVISSETSNVMTQLLRSAVEGGESVALRNMKYRVSGKTGTAQIPVGGKYDPNKTNVTFVGFPFKDRSFVMLIRLDEPTTSTYSATTVVPLWVETFREIAPLFDISPDR